MVVAGIGDVADARDQGVSKALVLERNRTGPMDAALPEKLIASAFAYRQLNRPALEAYAMWSCHANAHGLPALPLAAVHAEMTKCFARPAGDACVRNLRDRVMGISRKGGAQAMADTPDMLAIRRTPTNKAPPQDTVTHTPIPGSCEKPAYPKESLRKGEGGAVTIKFFIDAEGVVVDGKIVKSSGVDRLDQEALSALGRCKYVPLLKDGKPDSGFIRAGHTFTPEPK